MARPKRLTRRRFLRRTLAVGVPAILAGPLAGRCAPAAPARGEDDGWQIGCWTRPWAKHEYRVAMDAVAEAGFKYISFTGAKTTTGRVIAPKTTLAESEQVGHDARQRGLEITYVYGGGLPLHTGTDSLRRMIDNCAAAGGRAVVVAHLGDERTYDRHCEAIADCCDYAAQRQVAIVLKPHGGLSGTGPLCRKTIQRVGHKSFTLLYDPGNIFYYSDGELDPVEDAATVDGLVTGMSVKDYCHPKNVAITPGTGQVDFPALMARLARGGFTHGPLVVETLAPGDPDQTLREARKARRFLEKLVSFPQTPQ